MNCLKSELCASLSKTIRVSETIMRTFKTQESMNKVKDAQSICATKSHERGLRARESYYANPVKCLLCNTVIEYENRNTAKFCSHSCSAIYSNTHRAVPRFCKNCGKEYKTAGKEFCSRVCTKEYRKSKIIVEWKSGVFGGSSPSGKAISETIRKFLFEDVGYACPKCGWHEINPKIGICPLVIHHKDGNYKNNKQENLEVLCPNCHALTENYGALNKGSGRKYRYA